MHLSRLCFLLSAFLMLAPTNTGDTPQQTVEAFIAAWNARDHKGAAQQVLGAKSERDVPLIPRNGWTTIQLTSITIRQSGNSAVAHVKFELGDAEEVEQLQEAVQLKRVGDDWKVVPAKEINPSKALIAGLALFISKPAKVMRDARAEAAADVCHSNMRMLTLAFHMVAGDDDDYRFRFDPAKAKSASRREDKYWKCPLGAGQTSYSFNAKLAYKSLDVVKQPEKTILVYEGAKGKLVFRHQGRAAVGLADGRSKMVTAAEAKLLKWTP
jgi:hypothetical protein